MVLIKYFFLKIFCYVYPWRRRGQRREPAGRIRSEPERMTAKEEGSETTKEEGSKEAAGWIWSTGQRLGGPDRTTAEEELEDEAGR